MKIITLALSYSITLLMCLCFFLFSLMCCRGHMSPEDLDEKIQLAKSQVVQAGMEVILLYVVVYPPNKHSKFMTYISLSR